MTKPKGYLELGTRVSFTRTIRRVSVPTREVESLPQRMLLAPQAGGHTFGKKWAVSPPLEWTYIPEPKPQEGLVIGVRTLSNGWAEWWSDEPITFHGTERFTAYLVAFHIRRAPVFALPEQLTVLS